MIYRKAPGYFNVPSFERGGIDRRQGEQRNNRAANLRRLSIDQFGQILVALPSDNWPNLTKLLPGMTPDSAQKEWTGSSGDSLLRQSNNFMNFLAAPFAGVTGQSIHGKMSSIRLRLGTLATPVSLFSMTRSSITVATPFRFSIGLIVRKRRARREPRPFQRAREGESRTTLGRSTTNFSDWWRRRTRGTRDPVPMMKVLPGMIALIGDAPGSVADLPARPYTKALTMVRIHDWSGPVERVAVIIRGTDVQNFGRRDGIAAFPTFAV
ncbi:hypothetical protein I6F35_39000 [Bradyrhizobium sp. BRP22]|uniref:hypothetical protein n=1 Tax=Bradyrhizobium sp. BRP22 TaxID=2793821 RepID=UPI001CD2D719|nr:hypothetical protein [Bradyrhizobium sp. BRP22]MCA1459015.1 hypothetical protein [Bradyrhizobium sp. BRP22]